MTPFLALPNDLLWSVGYFLDTGDLVCLRRTHRRLGQAASRCAMGACIIHEASPALIQHIVAQRRRHLTHVHIKIAFPPTSTEMDALVALTRLEHLTTLEIDMYDTVCEKFNSLESALPLLRFARLSALRVGGHVRASALDDACAFIMALLEHTHSLEHLELDGYQEHGFSHLYKWTQGVLHTLANLRCLEVSDTFLGDMQEAIKAAASTQILHLPRLEYLCLGARHVDFGCAAPQDMPMNAAPNLVTLTATITGDDDFLCLPSNVQVIRLIVWGSTLEATLVSALLSKPFVHLTSLVLEESNQMVVVDDLPIIIPQQFNPNMIPQLAKLTVSWCFEPGHLSVLTDLANTLPMLRSIHLEMRTQNELTYTQDTNALMLALDTMRGTIPNHIQLTVSHVDQCAVIGQVIEDQMRVDNRWMPTHGWNKLASKRLALAESTTHPLILFPPR
jgi:hypothetical protein